MALADDDKHIFRCAASIAPVTDWTYYGKFALKQNFYSNAIAENRI